MEERSAGSINRPSVFLIEPYNVMSVVPSFREVILQQSPPTPPNADDFYAVINCPVDNPFDARIQSWYVSPACQDSDSHVLIPSFFIIWDVSFPHPAMHLQCIDKFQTIQATMFVITL
jgi:hypothetical protein